MVKTIVGTIFAVVLFFVGVFSLNYFGFIQYSFFAPKMEQVRYDTFKNSQTYNDGMIRELYNIKLQYDVAASNNDAVSKATLKAYALHEFSVYNVTRLPTDLQAFYYQLKGE